MPPVAAEEPLLRPHPIGQLGQQVGLHAHLGDARQRLVEILEPFLAADPAGRRGAEIALRLLDVGPVRHGLQRHQHAVAGADVTRRQRLGRRSCRSCLGVQVDQLVAAGDDALAEQEPGGQFEVVPRGPHGDHERAAVHPDFQRRLDRNHVKHDLLVRPADRHAADTCRSIERRAVSHRCDSIPRRLDGPPAGTPD